jgi:hypothetical protein
MDPLSLAANITGLIAFGNKVVALTTQALSDLHDYPKEFEELSGEVRGLCWLLSGIKKEGELWMKRHDGNKNAEGNLCAKHSKPVSRFLERYECSSTSLRKDIRGIGRLSH